MIEVYSAPPAPAPGLRLFCARDQMLESLPVLIFYGPSTTGNTTQNTSRIQAHIFSLAGFGSYLKLTIAPTSPLYAAVSHLPSDLQGDEVYRGLAISLLCYFASLADGTKMSLRSLAASRRPNGLAPMMFDEMHAGELAAMMEEIEEPGPILKYLTTAIAQQSISYVDMDILLPVGSMKRAVAIEDQEQMLAFDEDGLPLFDYGRYDQLIRELGKSTFLPTSKLKRAPSRPTAYNRSRMLSKDAKITLRREMCELVDTENSYREKLNETVNKTAVFFREQNGTGSVEGLFPNSLEQIFKLSSSFYDEIQSVLDTTEDEAIRDIESLVPDKPEVEAYGVSTTRRDPTGATAFAKVLLAWFPKFLGPYQDYLHASSHFQKIIGEGLVDASSKLSNGFIDIGEQRLRSCLIEPVQRLPRYSLLIDNMVNLLPSSHPSLSSFLKARDMVTEICALDTSASSDESKHSRILSTIVQDWPASSAKQGRLIIAVDVVELDPPFELSGKGNPGLLLLFRDRLVLLDKVGDGALSARGILAELDRPTWPTYSDLHSSLNDRKSLAVSESFELSETQFIESKNGRLIHLISRASIHQTTDHTTHCKVFCLQGPYESKASRFSEEIAKARIEGRYQESIRENGKWALRTVTEPDKLGVLAALSESGQWRDPGVQKPFGSIVLSVGDAVPAEGASKSSITARIVTSDFIRYNLEVVGSNNKPCKVECSVQTVTSSLLKQLGEAIKQEHLQSVHYQTSYHRSLLNSLPIREQRGQTKHQGYRPISPIKMLSKVFGGDSTFSRNALKPSRDTPNMKCFSSLPQPSSSKEQASVDEDSDTKGAGSKVTVMDANSGTYKNPLTLLEDTFKAYIFALRLRSGNVVGKVLHNRATADELSINELYNKFLEDPSRVQTAADSSVGVLFAAFEKFLRVAWRERMGPLIGPLALQSLQSSLDAGRPAVFAQDLKNILEEMSPQSRRCFAALVKLLAELLDASGNDGDRGVLIASFSEALVLVGNPQEYITLLDRLVDDFDRLFEDAVEKPGSSGSMTGSTTTNRSINAGSFSSNTSSLRRKFGLAGGLSRENSKSEPESKVASIWRNLSKNARSPGEGLTQANSQPESISKASLVRSRSTDTAPTMLAPFRPESRNKPLTSGFGVSDESRSRPGSSHNTIGIMCSIDEGGLNHPISVKKKQRRSSLSDLVKVQESTALPPPAPLHPRKLPLTPSPEKTRTLPNTPSPRKPSVTNRLDKASPPRSGIPRLGSPQRSGSSPLRAGSKENSPSPRIARMKQPNVQTTGEVTITSYSPQKRATSRSNIAPPRTGGLSERAWPPNNNMPHKVSAVEGSPRKLRMQSPQKIRERLSQEQKAVAGTETGLQHEINKIGEEMATFKLRANASSVSFAPSKGERHNLDALSTRLDTISKSLQTFITTHTETTQSLRADLDSSLVVTNKRARHFDDLYKEANAENEALYERFNDELGKILSRVRKGEGVAEMKTRMDDAVKEVASLKSERVKLKREIAGLKSLVKE